MNEKKLKGELRKFMDYIVGYIIKLPTKKLKPSERPYFRWKVRKFEYTEKGVVAKSASGDHFTKETWSYVAEKLRNSIKETEKYKSCLSIISDNIPNNEHISTNLDSFLRKIVIYYLKNRKLSKQKISYFIRLFISDLKNEPVKCWADVDLDGIALGFKRLNLTNNVTIKRVEKKDFERPIPIDYPYLTDSYSLQNISATLKVTQVSHGGGELQEFIEKIIAILRLFKVGSIIYLSYTMNSESPSAFIGGTISTSRKNTPQERYFVGMEEQDKFKDFLQVVEKHLPRSFYGFGVEKTDYITIAYNRYCDALLEGGLPEKRIMNIMMGFEALFINENQELGYRLKIRVSKFLSILGMDPYSIKDKLKDAYAIRSLFSHGSVLDYKSRKKYERRYGELNGFITEILDYLRICIVLTMLVNLNKDKFVDMVDDSFIDKDKERILSNLVLKWKKLIK